MNGDKSIGESVEIIRNLRQRVEALDLIIDDLQTRLEGVVYENEYTCTPETQELRAFLPIFHNIRNSFQASAGFLERWDDWLIKVSKLRGAP